jgi:hypothetical protein
MLCLIAGQRYEYADCTMQSFLMACISSVTVEGIRTSQGFVRSIRLFLVWGCSKVV